MNWEANWSEDAENELATLWLDPALRAAVTRASQLIDERLEANGDSEGESRSGNRRITFEPPARGIVHGRPDDAPDYGHARLGLRDVRGTAMSTDAKPTPGPLPTQTPEQAARLRAIAEKQGTLGKSTFENLLGAGAHLWESDGEFDRFLELIREARGKE